MYYTSLKILEKFPDADPILTKKAVLLHDLGKSRFNISLLDRVFGNASQEVGEGGLSFRGKSSMYLIINICTLYIRLKWW